MTRWSAGWAVVMVLCSGAGSVRARIELGGLQRVQPAGLDRVAEFRFDVRGRVGNPYDPDAIAIDAEVAGPGGRRWTVPAFWFEPFQRDVKGGGRELADVRRMRLFISQSDFGPNRTVRFAVDDMRLVDSATGRTQVIDDFEGASRWRTSAGVSLRKAAPAAGTGKASLCVEIRTDAKRGWPGLNLDLDQTDWTGYDLLRVRVRPIVGLHRGAVRCEYLTGSRRKFQKTLYERQGVVETSGWREVTWRLPRAHPASTWRPAGSGQWRVRIAAPEDGAYTIRLVARCASGQVAGRPATFELRGLEPDGFLRVDKAAKRYLRFESGKPYLAIGPNLIAADLSVFDYYVPKFAAAGCNFLRFWMAGRYLGVERDRLTRYDQGAAAAVDGLVSLARAHDVRLMFCLTDFREASDFHHAQYWSKTAYSSICDSPGAFFTSKAAMHAYRKRLRYIVARWSASAAVHSWEFFNEVNITNGWRTAPESVRAWHRAMGEHLKRIDPYQHVVTSSLAGLPDDALWAEPTMEIAQRHFYDDRFTSFAPMLAEGMRLLGAHGKPTLLGEFGRRKNRFADADAEGVSLHNGIWAPVMAGSAGTGVPWWWGWIDEYGLYRHFAAFAGFARDVRWHDEAYAPVGPDAIQTLVAGRAASDAPRTVNLIPTRGSFRPAPFNQAVTVRVHPDGSLDKPDAVSNLLHGRRNHKDLHNAQTFVVDFPAPGSFQVFVDGVSGHGGAHLTIRVDGKLALDRDFKDKSEAEKTFIMEYNRRYAVDVGAGEHRITVENVGHDWLRVPLIRLTRYGCVAPAVEAMGLRGRSGWLLWLRNTTYVWSNPLLDLEVVPARQVRVRLPGARPGVYTVERFDPQAGRWLDEREVGATDGLTIPAGDIAKDLALRVTRR